MNPLQARQTRRERLVAVGGLVLAVSSLLVIRLDAAEAAKSAAVAAALLAGYLVCALLLSACSAATKSFRCYAGRVTGRVDLAICGLLLDPADKLRQSIILGLRVLFIGGCAALQAPDLLVQGIRTGPAGGTAPQSGAREPGARQADDE